MRCMPSSYGRGVAIVFFVFMLTSSLFVHAASLTPTQLLLQEIQPHPSTITPVTISPDVNLSAQFPIASTTLPTTLSAAKATLLKTLYAELAALEAQLAALEASSSTPASTSSCTPLTITRSLALGSTGTDVFALQQFLRSKGYYTYPLITGYYGAVTVKAVAAFQSANGISPVGSVGPLTRAKIAALTSSCIIAGGGSNSRVIPSIPTTIAMTATSTATTTPIAPIIPSLTYGGGEGGGSGGGGGYSGGGGSSPIPDTTPPSVSLTAPTASSTIGGSSVTLTATASDNVAVANVQFKVDGTNIGSAITSSPYTKTWDSTGVSNDSHTLYAVAEDTSGNYATSSVSVTVNNACNTGLFPSDSGIINVKSFGAKGDGVTDDTAAILAAIATIPTWSIYPDPYIAKIVYFPPGTYLVSAPIERGSPGSFQPALILMGANRNTTTIKLEDSAPGYNDPNNPKGVIYTASGNPFVPSTGTGNSAFNNYVQGLTINVGTGNSGAIGIDYIANNIGAVRDVTITGAGAIGLSMLRDYSGPTEISNVSIQGFPIGIDINWPLALITIDNVQITGASVAGLQSSMNVVAFNNLSITTTGTGLAVVNTDVNAYTGSPYSFLEGLLVGQNSTFTGPGAEPLNSTASRNFYHVSASGFTSGNGSLDGVYHGSTQLPGPNWTLPATEPPAEDDTECWTNIDNTGAVTYPADSTSAWQACRISVGQRRLYRNAVQDKYSATT
jgi:peptidoglycan hydrolase-like protein with peptidoglycan-binding domain